MAYAWGPEREIFDSQASHAVLNSVFNAPGVGDERNFVRVRKVGAAGQRTDAVEVIEGGRYEVYIYFRNDAESEALTGVRAQSYFGRYVARDFDATVKAGLKADGQVVIWDTVRFVTNSVRPLELKYVEGSAKIHSAGAVNGAKVEGVFRYPGAALGYDVLNGTLVGGMEHGGYITYEVEAVATLTAEAAAIYGEDLARLETEAVEGVTQAQDVPVEGEMPMTGVDGGLALAILMGAVVALGWSLLRKIGKYGRLE